MCCFFLVVYILTLGLSRIVSFAVLSAHVVFSIRKEGLAHSFLPWAFLLCCSRLAMVLNFSGDGQRMHLCFLGPMMCRASMWFRTFCRLWFFPHIRQNFFFWPVLLRLSVKISLSRSVRYRAWSSFEMISIPSTSSGCFILLRGSPLRRTIPGGKFGIFSVCSLPPGATWDSTSLALSLSCNFNVLQFNGKFV